MKTLNEMYQLHKEKKLEVLTVNSAKALKGKKIQILNFGYAHQDTTDEFVIGDVMSELEYYRQLKEDCYPDKHGHMNRAEYWESYMTPEQLKEHRETLVVVNDNGENTYIFYNPKYDYDNSGTFYMGDVDRLVFFMMVEG